MATLTTQLPSLAGTTPAYVAATGGGDEFTPDEHTVLLVKNGSGATITVGVVTTGTGAAGLAEADVSVAIAAGAESMIGPFPRGAFLGSDGLASITYSGVTSLTIAVVKASHS